MSSERSFYDANHRNVDVVVCEFAEAQQCVALDLEIDIDGHALCARGAPGTACKLQIRGALEHATSSVHALDETYLGARAVVA